jgi:hypothetical protein
LFKEDNIARYTGVDTQNIRIDLESEGVSGEVGLIAPNSAREVRRGCVLPLRSRAVRG